MENELKNGKVVKAIGTIVDVRFLDSYLPDLLTALIIKLNGKDLYLEVEQHVGDDTARCVAMGPTEGIYRGMEVINTGKPIEVPVGEATLGRMFNVLGEPIDEIEDVSEIEKAKRMPIHRNPPAFNEQEPHSQILETGIKVIDLLLTLLPATFNYVEHDANFPPDLETTIDNIVHKLIRKYLANLLFIKLNESYLSENSSRRNAMDNADKNAEELSEKLTIEYNKARQAAITQEITEVVAGSTSK